VDGNRGLLTGDVVWDSTGSRPRTVRIDIPLPQADDLGDAVKDFLSHHADELRVPSVDDLELVQKVKTQTGHTVRLVQKHGGLPIFGAEVLVVVDSDQRVRQIALNHEPRVRTIEAVRDADRMKPREVLKRAREVVGDAVARSEPPPPTDVYYPTTDGLRRAYVVQLPVRGETQPHDWQIVLDAYTGEVLEQRDLIVFVDGQGFVFDQNPVVTANDDSLRDPDATVATCGFAGTARATIDAQRVTQKLKDISFVGGVHRLDGPFVQMHEFGAPTTTFPQEANANDFNYSSGDDRFECVNIYYHIDTLQRYLQSIGVMSAHNSVIQCDPHEGSSGAAFFSPVDGGLHFSNSGPCQPDRAEDGDVIAHEYGHAIQNDQVPGWGVTNPITHRAETGAMGEGFGDALACVFFSDQGGGYHREVFEPWIFGDAGGLRRVDGTKIYPTDWNSEVHDDGEIWSAALWNIFRTIGGDSLNAAVRAEARCAVIKSVVLSHHRLLASASMPEGAEAVMIENAALDEYLGAHLMQMLDSFHARGLLVCDASANLTIEDGPTFYNSPNLWVRNSDDGLTTNQEPESGQDNFFHARVRNTGPVTARAFVVTFNVKPWAGTEFVYPGDFLPYISAAVGFNLAAGASTIVKARWPAPSVPAAGTHACLLASVYTPVDATPAGLHVWDSDNLAQKNMTVIDLMPNDSVTVDVQLGNLARLEPERFRIEIQRPGEWQRVPVAIVSKNPDVTRTLVASMTEIAIPTRVPVTRPPTMRFLEPSHVEIVQPGSAARTPVRLMLARNSILDIGGEGEAPGANRAEDGLDFGSERNETDIRTDSEGMAVLGFRTGANAGFPLTLPGRASLTAGLKITAPAEARPGDVIQVDLVQRNSNGQIVGGITVQANIVAEK
jgi:hypothetical protein